MSTHEQKSEHNDRPGSQEHHAQHDSNTPGEGASAPSPNNKRKEVNRARRGHRFYPSAEELRRLPALGAMGGTPFEEATIWLHYFFGGSDWWVTEYDPETAVAFGYVCLNGWTDSAEWGAFSLEELEQLTGPLGFPIEPGLLLEAQEGWTSQSSRVALGQR